MATFGFLGNAIYRNNQWLCDPVTKPQPTSNQQGYCCPSGWITSSYNDPAPCRTEQDLYDCGPLPPGATRINAVCCSRARQWFAKDPSGRDPCGILNLRASEILAAGDITPEEIATKEKIVTPGMILAGSLAAILMIVLTLVVQK